MPGVARPFARSTSVTRGPGRRRIQRRGRRGTGEHGLSRDPRGRRLPHAGGARVAVEIHADHEVGPEGPRDRHRNRVDQGPVEEESAAAAHRREDARQGVGGAQGLHEAASREPDLLATVEVGGDAGEADRQALDAAIGEVVLEAPLQAVTGDEAGAEPQVEEAHHAAPGQRQGEGLEQAELARRVAAPHHCADGAARHHGRVDAGLLQHLDHPDLRPAPGRAAAEREADAGTGGWGRRHGLDGTGGKARARGRDLPDLDPGRPRGQAIPHHRHEAQGQGTQASRRGRTRIEQVRIAPRSGIGAP